MTTDVVIPARNEERTIAAIAQVFRQHWAIGQVIVSVDGDTQDYTVEHAANLPGVTVITSGAKGKGQVVSAGLALVKTKRVIFCDADLTGLTIEHITRLCLFTDRWAQNMVIGVPDLPPEKDIPANFMNTIFWAWPWMSGERSLPTDIARRPNLSGYLMETQLNYAIHQSERKVRFTILRGLISPLNLDEQRLKEMERDRRIGIVRGLLPQ